MPHPGQGKLSTSYQDGVRDRLQQWWAKRRLEEPERYGTPTALAKTLGIARGTLLGWLRPKAPKKKKKKQPAPSVPQLVQLAEVERLSPTWLLLGIGPEFVDGSVAARDLGPDLRAHVVEELARRWGSELRSVRRDTRWIDSQIPGSDRLLIDVVAAYSKIVEAGLKALHWDPLRERARELQRPTREP